MSKRQNKGHPKRQARRDRAADRATTPTPIERTKAYRLQSVYDPEVGRRIPRPTRRAQTAPAA
jgi:hypothetical protein